MTIHSAEFPFEDYKNDIGDFFFSMAEAQAAGFDDDQIWSVTEGDEENMWTYGPPHHWINVIGYIGTIERHDHNTYYEERFSDPTQR